MTQLEFPETALCLRFHEGVTCHNHTTHKRTSWIVLYSAERLLRRQRKG